MALIAVGCVIVIAAALGVFAFTRSRPYTGAQIAAVFPLQAGSLTLTHQDRLSNQVVTSATPSCTYVPELIFTQGSEHNQSVDRDVAAPDGARQPFVRIERFDRDAADQSASTRYLRDEFDDCKSIQISGDVTGSLTITDAGTPDGLGERLEWAVTVNGAVVDMQVWTYRNIIVTIVGSDHAQVVAIGAALKKKLG